MRFTNLFPLRTYVHTLDLIIIIKLYSKQPSFVSDCFTFFFFGFFCLFCFWFLLLSIWFYSCFVLFCIIIPISEHNCFEHATTKIKSKLLRKLQTADEVFSNKNLITKILFCTFPPTLLEYNCLYKLV